MPAESEVVPSSIFSASSRAAKIIRNAIVGVAMTAASLASATPSEAAGGPGYAGIVVDARTGAVLYSENADTLHYPASLTKMMTIYLAFEALEAGRIRLDSPVPISAHAAAQAPTKLGVRAGTTITVQQAILGMVTLSANDAAMALGEYLGGSEENFARMMNEKARALGMTRTTYRNPNGLPNTAQMTTARDQSRLGMALREHFPQYYGVFSVKSFQFGSRTIYGHNRLVGSIKGVDGIKTGYTRAAGFNLVSSLKDDGRSIVGVVLGGASTPARDNQMRKLLAAYLPKASVDGRAAPVVAQQLTTQSIQPPMPVVAQSAAPVQPDPAAAAVRMAAAAKVRLPQSGPTPDVRYTEPSSAAAFAAITPRSDNPLVNTKRHNQKVPANEVASIAPAYAEGDATVDTVTTASTPASVKAAKAEKSPSGWSIQIGVSPSKEMASDLLDNAKGKGGKLLHSAKPYTVAFGSGASQVYRARFGGFDDQRDAVNACKALKKSGIKCWATME